jgi:hypothetical protein
MNTKAYLVVSTLIFTVVAVVHLIRFVLGWTVQLGAWNVPPGMSILAVLVSSGVALWGLTLMRRV